MTGLSVNQVVHGIRQLFSDTDRGFIVENNCKYT